MSYSVNPLVFKSIFAVPTDIVDIAVCVLILLTTIELWKHSIVDKFTTFIFVLTIILSILKISPYFVIIIAGLLGLIKYVFYTKYTMAKENTNE